MNWVRVDLGTCGSSKPLVGWTSDMRFRLHSMYSVFRISLVKHYGSKKRKKIEQRSV